MELHLEIKKNAYDRYMDMLMKRALQKMEDEDEKDEDEDDIENEENDACNT